MNNEEIQNLRKNYKRNVFHEENAHENPITQFEVWFKEALSSLCDEPNAFTLSTIKAERPRSRVVLLKGITTEGFIFFTNYESDKGQEIKANPLCAMNFLWLPLERQVRIEGIIEKVKKEISDDYFSKRPRGSQIGAIASPQSQILQSREDLENHFKNLELKYAPESIISRPDNWGGYLVKPNYFEFWQGRESRLHDRICYQFKDNNWLKFRLAP
jgi:pyridoxamine-phosphate oxidase